jgi:hypothetical protein
MSKGQKKFIKLIEENLKVKYSGPDNVVVASNFIEKYARQHRQYCRDNNIDSPITIKQRVYIHDIEEVLNIKFKGTTLDEASDFIDDHVGEFNAVCKFINRRAKLRKEIDLLKREEEL